MVFAARRGLLRSYILYCRDHPASFLLGYQYRGQYYHTDIGYDPDYAKQGVGSVLQLEVMQHMYEDGERPEIFDFSTHVPACASATDGAGGMILAAQNQDPTPDRVWVSRVDHNGTELWGDGGVQLPFIVP